MSEQSAAAPNVAAEPPLSRREADEFTAIQFVREQLKELIGGLEPVQRIIVLLKLGAGWEHSRIAEMLLVTNERLACRWAHTKAKLVRWTKYKRPELFPHRKRKRQE